MCTDKTKRIGYDCPDGCLDNGVLAHPALWAYFSTTPNADAMMRFPQKVCGYPRNTASGSMFETELKRWLRKTPQKAGFLITIPSLLLELQFANLPVAGVSMATSALVVHKKHCKAKCWLAIGTQSSADACIYMALIQSDHPLPCNQ